MGRWPPVTKLHFQNHRQNQRPLRRLLIDISLQIHANLFLNHRPVRPLLQIRILHRPRHTFPRPRQHLVPVLAHQSARHNLRRRLHSSRVLVNRDNRNHHTLFRQMFPVAHHNLFNLLSEPESTNTRPAGTGSRRNVPSRHPIPSIPPSEPESTSTRPAGTGSRRNAPSSVNSTHFPSSSSKISPLTTPNWCASAACRNKCRYSPCTGIKYFGFTSCSSNFCSSWLACPETCIGPAELS